MRKTNVFSKTIALMIAGGMAAAALTPVPGLAASHREAPLISRDATADITDLHAFRSWNDPSKVVLIMNVIPGEEPSSGPNYWNFDDDVRYRFNIDVNQDGIAGDIVYEVRFQTEIRGLSAQNDFSQAYLGNADAPNTIPPITALDGNGSQGLSLRQRYIVTEIRGKSNRNLGQQTMFAVPSNVGPRTMPNYEDLADQGIYPLNNGGRVFAGQRDETFYIDLGAVFDTVNLRGGPVLSPEADANNGRNPFGVDHFSGFNVHSIAIEVPISEITNQPNAVIGVYASTSRSSTTRRQGAPQALDPDDNPIRGTGQPVQVARLGNPLVNELLIGIADKDRWNGTTPENEAQFLDYYRNPPVVAQLNLLFGTNFPTTGRTDLVAALLKYPGQNPNVCSRENRCSDLLRLNLAVAPTPPDQQRRLGGLASPSDPAGFPNGRRPNDDVTDIVLRVAAGALRGPVPRLGDGVNFNIGAVGSNATANGIERDFPFLPTPHDGRNRKHIDCGEPGGNPCN